MKKTISIIAALCMLVSLVASFGCVDASAATDNVSLYSTRVIAAGYGAAQTAVFVKTNDNAADQQVYLHQKIGTEWVDVEASYKTTLNDGSKIWEASIITHSETEYAIKYVADGVTYWDNNNGQNYSTSDRLGEANVEVNTVGNYFSYNSAQINATVKNLAYNKNVVVRYTTDNWNTFHDVPMSYGYTNENGTENWSVILHPYGTINANFKFCIYYEVNGQTYWANNFGANYSTYEIVHR